MHLKLVDKKQEVKSVTSFIFEPATSLVWQAGQFMRYHLSNPSADQRGEDRYFTIASSPDEQKIMLTTRFVPDDGSTPIRSVPTKSGSGSTFKKDLQNLQIGDVVEAEGPAGEFIITDPNENYIFIAGGIGITPFRSILLDLDHRHLPVNVTLLYANRDHHIVYQEELEALLPNHPNFKIHYFIEPQRIDEQAIRKSVPDLPTGRLVFYVSGPKPMVEAMEKLLKEMGIAGEAIKHDYFPGYQSI